MIAPLTRLLLWQALRLVVLLFQHLGRPFALDRHTDPTGVSGTGTVAWGWAIPDHWVLLRWRGPRGSWTIHRSMANLEAIHCHGGQTVVRWITPGHPVAGAGIPWDSPTRPVSADQMAAIRARARTYTQRTPEDRALAEARLRDAIRQSRADD